MNRHSQQVSEVSNGRVFPSLIEQSFQQLPLSLVINLVNGLILAAVLWDAVSLAVILGWFGALVIVTAARYQSLRIFRRTVPKGPQNEARWKVYFVLGVFTSGLVWGAAGIVLFPPSSFAHQIFLTFMLGGMVAGAVAQLSAIKYAFWLYAIPVVLPIGIRMLLVGEPLHLLMGLMIGLFTITMLLSSVRVQAVFQESDMLHSELLSSIELSDALRHMVRMDVLTKIPNRLLFEEELRREWGRAERDNESLAVIMVDIDHFKEYNDLYGHPAGDKCLVTVADTMQKSLYRPGDVVARVGGEEFAFLLPNTDLEGAIAVAEQVQARLRNKHIRHEGSPINKQVTLSFGVATSMDSGVTSSSELVGRADAALYRAKRNGRDQIKNNAGEFARLRRKQYIFN